MSMIIPMCSLRGESLRRDNFWLWVMARINLGASFAEASDQLRTMSPSLMEATVPSFYSAQSLNLYRRLRLEAKRRQIERINKRVDGPDRIVLADPIVEALRQ